MQISIDQFADAVNQLLAEYGDEASEKTEEVVRSVTKEAQKRVKTSGSFGGTGRYRKAWKTEFEKTRLGITGNVYNSKPRPLEFGHVLVAGGRAQGFVDGREHINPVNEWAQEEAMQRIEEGLKG